MLFLYQCHGSGNDHANPAPIKLALAAVPKMFKAIQNSHETLLASKSILESSLSAADAKIDN